ncbi:MAG: VWA domain-containing protein [Candidatus Melainabacteria bacterium]|nr:VWA domain-containing protein [Candidatus Melainabacteria bacterium]
MRANSARNQKGAMIILICFLIGMIALPMIGMFTFEIVRATAIREQLRSACQSAALAGAATLASSDNTDPLTTHNAVIAAAREAFRANTISEFVLTAADQVAVANHNPDSDKASIFIELLDPNSNPANQPVSLGDTNGRIVHVVGAFGLKPVFGDFLGITGPFTLRADGHGRVPQLDIVLCFDVSGSIDDQTPVTFVKRYWDQAQGRIRYQLVNARPGAPTPGGMAHGRLFDIVGPPPTGTGLNAHFPQTLEASSSGCDRPLSFSAGLRGNTNAGSPPGNYPGGGGTGNQYTYTDLVVNISEAADSTMTLPFTSPGGYYYPNLETVVEASRGNLENGAVFTQAKLNTVPELNTVTPTPGYLSDYQTNARMKLRPIYDAQEAAKEFFTIMNTNTEAHFGFVSFSTTAGTSPTETQPANNVASSYPQGGQGNFPLPTISLDKNNTKYTDILNVIPTTVAYGSTNIGDALNRARQQLVSNNRPGARRAIVLFTDGQPTAPSGGGQPWSYARSAAQQIKDEGIPIYTIGLAQNSQVIPGECNILNDDPNKTINYTDTSGNPQSYTPGAGNPGVSYIAGNGGKFFLVTSTASLRLTFENIARQLVQIVSVD